MYTCFLIQGSSNSNSMYIWNHAQLELKRIRRNKIRKFYWNKKMFNVKKLGAAKLQNIIRKNLY